MVWLLIVTYIITCMVYGLNLECLFFPPYISKQDCFHSYRNPMSQYNLGIFLCHSYDQKFLGNSDRTIRIRSDYIGLSESDQTTLDWTRSDRNRGGSVKTSLYDDRNRIKPWIDQPSGMSPLLDNSVALQSPTK